MENTINTTSIDSQEVISWLEKRISTTEVERDNSKELNVTITKGAKLTVYKEILEYIKSHSK